MTDEAEIVKELREAEKFGRLQSKVQGAYGELETTEESSEDVPKETTRFVEDDVERKTRVDDTNSERSRETISEIEEKYRNLVETINEQIWEVDVNGVYTYISPKTRDVYGLEPEEVVGKTPFDLMPPGEAERVAAEFKKILKSRKPFSGLENLAQHKDGRVLVMETSGTPFFASDGTLLGYRGTARDITERKQTEEALRESEEKFRTISMSVQDGIIMMDHDGKVSYWNKAAEKMFGYKSEEIIGKHLHHTLAPQSFHEAYKKGFSKFKDTGKGAAVGKTLELSALKKDGTEFPIELSVSSVKIRDKWSAIGLVRDITERKKVEGTLRESEEKFRKIFEGATDGILAADVKTKKFVFANPKICEITGYSPEELLKLDASKIHPKEELVHALDEFKKLMQKKITIAKNLPVLRKDKKVVYCDIVGKVMKIGTQEVLVGFFRDISAWKKAEEKLHQSEIKHKTLYESSQDAIMMLAPPTWKFTSGNPSTIEMFKAKNEEEFVSLGPWDLSPEYQPDGQLSSEKAKKMIEKAMKTGSNFFEWVHKRLNGEKFPATVLLTKMELECKELLQATVRDITKRKKAEEELKNKIDELGQYKRVTVGRELKMVELKKEINELCKKLGETPRYVLDKNGEK